MCDGFVPFRCGWPLSAGRAMSLLVPAGSHLPAYPQESTALRCTALCGDEGYHFCFTLLFSDVVVGVDDWFFLSWLIQNGEWLGKGGFVIVVVGCGNWRDEVE